MWTLLLLITPVHGGGGGGGDSTAGESLRFCRELNYAFSVPAYASEHLRTTPGSKHAADQQLVNHYAELSKDSAITLTCLYHWKNLYCSFAFAATDRGGRPCSVLCERVSAACTLSNVSTMCAPNDASQCTDYSLLTAHCDEDGDGEKARKKTLHKRPPQNSAHADQASVLLVVIATLIKFI